MADKIIPIDKYDLNSPISTLTRFADLPICSIVIVGLDSDGDVHIASGGNGSVVDYLGMVSAADYFIKKNWRP